MICNNTPNQKGHKNAFTVLCFISMLVGLVLCNTALWAASPQSAKAVNKKTNVKHVTRITPQIPNASRNQKDKVFLENADMLIADERISSDYQVLKGNVRFRRGDMYMFCDSAYFYDVTSSLDAFGHVKMSQADTLFAYADVLHYYGDEQVAQLRHNVRLENRKTTLVTDSLDYEVDANVGYFFDGGTIIDGKNNTRLSSQYGKYEFDTKQAEFTTNVLLENDRYTMETNYLQYNTASHIATIVDQTTIVSDGNTVVTTSGWYNTSADDATLYNRSQLNSKDGKTLVGDTIYYNRTYNYGEVRGNAVITDPKNKIILDGDYGYHDDNSHYSYVTRKARAREYSQKDTIYLHADTLCTLLDNDSVRVLKAIKNVRFFRSDIQGVCDSLQMSMADTIVNMYRHAVLWNENKQISGNEINAHLNDSTIDWATLPDFALMVQHVGENYYDQLSSKKVKTLFENKEMRQLDADGNVQVIMYPQENDSTYNKQVNAESSYLRLNLKEKQEVEKIAMWPDVSGKVAPLFLLKKSELYLPGFVWYDAIRPKDPDDIFDVSDEMKQLMSEPEKTTRRASKK